jgi:hypothetical protein
VDDAGKDVIAPNTDAKGSGYKEPDATPMSPWRCRRHIREQASEVWNVIVSNLLQKAKGGSVPHIALVVKLAGFEQGPMPPREPKQREKSLAQQLREEMEELEARNIAEFGE